MRRLDDTPLISILMPAYNAEQFIGEAINSILNQTYKNFELLIIDDASTDSTGLILKEFKDPRIRVFVNKENRGYLRSCNFLYKKATGLIIGFQDADDISHQQRLEKQINLILNDPDYFCGCNMKYMTFNGKMLNVVTDKNNIMQSEYPRIGDSTLLIQKRQLERIGGLYRSYFINHQDYDLGLRLLDYFKYKNLDSPYYYYRNVPNSNSKSYVSPEKVINGDLARILAKERREKGYDSLMTNDRKFLEGVKSKLLKGYESDKTMMERRAVSYLLSIKMYNYALTLSLKAIKKEPSSVLVYRTLFYVLRKYVKDKISFK